VDRVRVSVGGVGACRGHSASKIASHYSESIAGGSSAPRKTHHWVPFAGMHTNG